MNSISIRLPDELLKEVDKLAKKLKLARTEYIRQAIETMNRKTINKERYDRLVKVSQRVRKESMVVNAEFDEFENDPEA
jgi:metal-responsive CopG/Arc/MetJ family transcriptional regulator